MKLVNLTASLVFLGCAASYAQQSPQPKITPVIQSSISGQTDKEFALVSIEWPPGSTSPRHTHPGDEYGTVILGALSVKLENGDWKTFKQGEAWHVPAGVVHEAKNTTFGITRTMNAYVVEKGKSLIQLLGQP